MGANFSAPDCGVSSGRWFGYRHHGANRVLLREPERCEECARVFISLYPITRCQDHEGLDEI